LALALAFPKFDFNLMAWVAFVPLLYAVHDQPPLRIFGYAVLQGLTCYLATVYWVVITLHNFADVPAPIAVLPLILLAAILALYTGASFVVADYVSRRLLIPIFVTLPVAFTAFEWLRSFFPIGFPWNLLGYTAYRNLDLIQFASITGVYGVSFLIVFFNAVVYGAISANRAERRVQIWGLSALTGCMVAALVFGSITIKQINHQPRRGSLKIALVQGNIPQSIKWDPQFLPTSFKIYVDQSELAAREHVDLIVWPEAAAAFVFQPDDRYPPSLAVHADYRQQLLQLARRTGKPILFGAPALQLEDGNVTSYNRAYLVTSNGAVANYYDKIQLVPFGEYIPLKWLFGYFVDKLVVGFGDLAPGHQQTLFDLNGAKLGVLICYESVFPDLSRREVARGADVLVNITNDAWYGESSAPYQLLTMAAMRAVETHTPMVRVANTGISAVIGPTGEITARTDLFTRNTEVETVSWLSQPTFYARFGDVFAELCFALAALALIWAWRYPRKRKPLAAFTAGLLSGNGHR
jgi:apolipoprotein N-acyltransferase